MSEFDKATPRPWAAQKATVGDRNEWEIVAQTDGWSPCDACPDGWFVATLHTDAGMETGDASANAALIVAAVNGHDQMQARVAELEAALREIAELAPEPDDHEWFDAWGDYAHYLTRHDGKVHTNSVDQGNSGDVHSHGISMGQHIAAVIARAALQGSNKP